MKDSQSKRFPVKEKQSLDEQKHYTYALSIRFEPLAIRKAGVLRMRDNLLIRMDYIEHIIVNEYRKIRSLPPIKWHKTRICRASFCRVTDHSGQHNYMLPHRTITLFMTSIGNVYRNSDFQCKCKRVILSNPSFSFSVSGNSASL